MYMGSDGRVPAWIMPGPDEIAHSAASQRGREGRRKRWWKVCATTKDLFNFCKKLITNIFRYVILIARYCVFSYPGWERRHMVTVTKGDLIALGYGPSFAADIIRETKKLMVSRGHTYYQSRKLDRVPKEAVEELLGITIPDKQN